jgi:hypothetical protein
MSDAIDFGEESMDRELVRTTLLEVLQSIHNKTPGIKHIEITCSTRPLEDMEKFTSKVWPIAITQLSILLGVPIPNDKNVFRLPRSRKALTVDESVDRILEIIAAGAQTARGAA